MRAGAPCSGTATSSPTAMPTTVPRTRRKPRTSVSPREAVFTKIHQTVPTAQYQRSAERSLSDAECEGAAAVAWMACRVVVRARPLPP